MKVMKWSAIALAVSAGSTQFAVADAFVSDQAEAKGFIEDSSLDLLLRNYYFNRDGKSGSGDRVDWTQGFLTTYESGFTQGTVGFGVDAFGYLGLKLDGTSDKSGTGNLPVMNDGTPRDDYSRAGGAVKVRISKTMLKWGEMQPTAPVFAAGGSRLFPQTATGFQLQSSELEGLDLEAGHFTEGKQGTTTKSRGELYATYAGETAKSADFIGGRYAITDNLSASLYGAELEDIYRQYYLNSNYTIPLASDQSLGFDFNIYRTNDEGKAKAGDISNTTWSLAVSSSRLWRRRSLPKLIVLLGVLRVFHQRQQLGQSLRLTHLHRAGWLLPEDEWEELLDFLEKEQFVCRAGGGEWVLCRDLGAYSLHRLLNRCPWPMPSRERMPANLDEAWYPPFQQAMERLQVEQEALFGESLAHWLADGTSGVKVT